MRKLRVVLFDFDFTLGDSSRGIVECVNHGLASIGRAAAGAQEIRRQIGLTLPEALVRLVPMCGEDERDRFVAAFHERASIVMAQATELYPGSVALVKALREAGIRTGIVSTKLRRRIEEILEVHGATGLFDVVVGLEDVAIPKPDPAGLLRAAAQVGAAIQESVYIGDHEVDVEAARGAGMRFVGVLTGMTSAERFNQLGVPWARDVSCAEELLTGGEGQLAEGRRQAAPHSGQCTRPSRSAGKSSSGYPHDGQRRSLSSDEHHASQSS